MADPIPVPYRGRTYPSMSALAKALGMSRATVSMAIRRGTLDRIGCGSHSSGPESCRAAQMARMQPVSVPGKRWPSQKAAAEELGISQNKVSRWLDNGAFTYRALKILEARHDT